MKSYSEAMYWKTKRKWYRVNHEKNCYELTEFAPPRAIQSFELYKLQNSTALSFGQLTLVRSGDNYEVISAFYVKAQDISLLTLHGRKVDFQKGDIFIDATGKEYVFEGYPMVCYRDVEKMPSMDEMDIVVKAMEKG